MATLLSLKSQLMSQWEAAVPAKEQPVTDVLRDRWDSIATAVLLAGDNTIKATTLNGGIITGGASAPAGPVAGAIMVMSPGAITSTLRWEGKTVFVPPTTMIGDYQVVYTGWLKTLQETISDCIASFWDAWFPTWSCAGVMAVGGVAAYTPPAPPSPGTPGPWTLGTITPFPLIGGQGLNPSPALGLLKSQMLSIAKSTPVSMWNNQQTTLIPTTNGEIIQGTIEAFCDAFTSTFQTWSTTALVTDATGVAAIGTAIPPVGTITGGTISGLTIL